MMVKLINFSMLLSKGLFTFSQRLLEIFKEKDLSSAGLEPLIKKAAKSFSEYSKAFELESKNPFTGKLASADADRDEAYIGFRNYIESCGHRNKAGWAEAAGKITDTLRKFGWSAANLGYKAETAALTKIIDEINNNSRTEITFLSAGDWFNDLVTAQNAFEQIQKESVSRDGTNGPTVSETRPELVNDIRNILRMLDLQYSICNNPEYTGNAELKNNINRIMNAINELITLTMVTEKANQTRSENKKNEPLPDGTAKL